MSQKEQNHKSDNNQEGLEFEEDSNEGKPSIKENFARHSEQDSSSDSSSLDFEGCCYLLDLSDEMLADIEKAMAYQEVKGIKHLKIYHLTELFFPDGKKPNFGEYVRLTKIGWILDRMADDQVRKTSLGEIKNTGQQLR